MAYAYPDASSERWQKGKGAEQDAAILREFKVGLGNQIEITVLTVAAQAQ